MMTCTNWAQNKEGRFVALSDHGWKACPRKHPHLPHTWWDGKQERGCKGIKE